MKGELLLKIVTGELEKMHFDKYLDMVSESGVVVIDYKGGSGR